ncbi:hypothetical protein [Campylobacter sp. 19-13652]|uniref:hypothetical protein n=1 Tax=Campylobacter sp. 19-13652 TaxID=2840180 RepID=UPI001C759C63|nr:hypothetical protein [Campylobacter sp. 19-13652]BCX79169.1 hypothetical protein LBC_06310 [Campylobacter sp. 19-13652]
MSQTLRSLFYLKAFGFKFYEPAKTKTKIEYTSLNELYAQIDRCQLCELSHLRQKNKQNASAGINLTTPKLVFVSILEVKNREFLTNIASKNLNIAKDEIDFISVIKCPAKDKINKHSINLCLPYFYNELSLRDIKAAIVLGDEACGYIFTEELSRARGIVQNIANTKAVACFSDEYVIKNPSKEGEFIADLIKIRSYL